MGATVSISLPIPKSRGSNGRDHWAAKANAIRRCKAYLDGLTDAGWWVDDRVLVEIKAAVFRGCGKDEGVTITAKDVEQRPDP